MSSKWSKGSSGPAGDEVANLVAFDTTQLTNADNRCNPQPGDPCHPLAAGAHAPAIAFRWMTGGEGDQTTSLPLEYDHGFREGDAHPTLDSNNGSRRHHGALIGAQVRRLTPRECERLQGFPDDYTLIPYNGKPAKDGPRYKALGNSMAVPVMKWIGEQIQAVEDDLDEATSRTPRAR